MAAVGDGTAVVTSWKRSPLRHLVGRLFLVAGVLMGAGCAGVLQHRSVESGDEGVNVAQPWTGRSLNREQMVRQTSAMFLGDELYAEVSSAWLRDFQRDYRAELFRLGVLRWDTRFDCQRFVQFYVGLAQARFFRVAFHTWQPAGALAIGPVWYLRADGTGHAIVQAVTERGTLFIDPQSGHEVELSAAERQGIFFQYF